MLSFVAGGKFLPGGTTQLDSLRYGGEWSKLKWLQLLQSFKGFKNINGTMRVGEKKAVNSAMLGAVCAPSPADPLTNSGCFCAVMTSATCTECCWPEPPPPPGLIFITAVRLGVQVPSVGVLQNFQNRIRKNRCTRVVLQKQSGRNREGEKEKNHVKKQAAARQGAAACKV